MELERLFLRKEELPIIHKSCFQIPIHHKLLDENIIINEDIAKEIFPQVAEEWYIDLKNYIPSSKEEKEWIDNVFLKNKPKITKEFNHQFVNGVWQDQIQTKDNGLVTCFSINRDGGGSLYFNEDEFNCQSFGNIYIKFSDEKKKEFQFEDRFNKMYTYAPNNIDHHPGVLFLRNWVIKYMNEVFKQVFK